VESIGLVVGNVRASVPKVIVVDDGSTDGTSKAARSAGADVVTCSQNAGKGAALRAGWKHAQELGFEWALSMDGDGQHSPDDIPAFFECAEQTSASLVIGNRMQNPTGMPSVRRFVNTWMSKRLSKAAGQNLPDSQCGFRLMNLAAWSALDLRTEHFEIESELTLSFARAGRKIAFVPIRTIYKSEHSKIHPIKDTLRWFRWFRETRS
jgi:glycosyltransferase involved in cell wall biosynthesis